MIRVPVVKLPNDNEIEKSIRIFLQEYKKYVDNYSPEYKGDLPYYYEEKIEVLITISPKSTNIRVLSKEKINKIIINHVEEKSFDHSTGTSMVNWFFYHFLQFPIEYAKRNVESFVSYFKMQEEISDYEYEKYLIDYNEEILGRYRNYFKKGNEIYEKTFSTLETECLEMCRILRTLEYLRISYIISPCISLNEVSPQIVRDVESSFFLAMQGKYIPAISLLRRWLDTFFSALFIDIQLCCDPKSKKYEQWNNLKEEWLNGKNTLPNFSGRFGIIENIINPDVEYYFQQLIKNEKKYCENTKKLYGNLSKYVHYGGIKEDELIFDFAEYNEALFKTWFMYVNEIYKLCNLTLLYYFPNINESFIQSTQDLDSFEWEELLDQEILSKLIKKII